MQDIAVHDISDKVGRPGVKLALTGLPLGYSLALMVSCRLNVRGSSLNGLRGRNRPCEGHLEIFKVKINLLFALHKNIKTQYR